MMAYRHQAQVRKLATTMMTLNADCSRRIAIAARQPFCRDGTEKSFQTYFISAIMMPAEAFSHGVRDTTSHQFHYRMLNGMTNRSRVAASSTPIRR